MAVVAAAIPDRSIEQRREALRKANDVRSARREFKQQVRFEPRRALDVLREPPAEFETMKVFDLLLAVPKAGRVKVSKWLARSRVSPSKTVAGLTGRQRDELMRELAPWFRLRGSI